MPQSLPEELRRHGAIAAANSRIVSLRAELSSVAAGAQTQSSSLRRALGDLPEKLETAVREQMKNVETALVPGERTDDFLSGTASLNEFARPESVHYYGGLTALLFLASGARAAALQIRDLPVKPLSPQPPAGDVYQAVLDPLEFEDNRTVPVSEIETDYVYHSLRGGQTVRDAVQEVFGTADSWQDALRDNEITDEFDLEEGTSVRIPRPAASGTDRNLVYEAAYDGTNAAKIRRYLFGRSVAIKPLGRSGGGSLVLTSSGAVALMEGIENLSKQILMRFRNPRGSLGPDNEEWGLDGVQDTGALQIVSMDRSISNMRAQMESDPRVTSALPDYRTLDISGDALRVTFDVRTISGESVALEAS